MKGDLLQVQHMASSRICLIVTAPFLGVCTLRIARNLRSSDHLLKGCDQRKVIYSRGERTFRAQQQVFWFQISVTDALGMYVRLCKALVWVKEAD
jgi:hypothetical protein